MRIRKFIASILTFCMLLGLFLVPAQSTYAANQAVMDARNGIIEVMQVITVDGKLFQGSRGTGFLVGNDEGSQTVITNHHVVNAFPYDEKQLNAYIKNYCKENEISEPDKGAKLTAEIRIAVKRDVYITAEIVNQSESGDFAILKMEQPIYDRTPLQLADSSQVTSTQKIYALGFPAAVEFQADVVHTAVDVTVTDGIISKVTEGTGTEAPVSTIFHSAPISEGNSGGPLVNEDGHVIGINTYGVSTTATSYYYSTEINEVTDVLTALGIEYTKAGESTVPETTDPVATTTPEVTPEETQEPEEDNSELFDSLNALIKEAENLETDGMTDESVKELEDGIEDAKAVYNDADSSKDQIEGAETALKKAMDSLEEERMSVGMIVGIAAAVIVVIIVVAIVVISNNNKKKQKHKAEIHQPVRVPPTPPITPPQPGRRPYVMPNDGSEETGILNDGSSETTVLSGQNIPTAYLIRRKNNERITISKAVFKIGKERRKVDFCISDNTNISRSHADIVYRNGEFFIVDNNATNGTSVNGASVPAGQDRKISNNDMIKLADEEFQFRTF